LKFQLIYERCLAQIYTIYGMFEKIYFSSDGDVDNWVGGKGDKGGDGGGRVIDYAEDAVMLQMEDDEIEAEAGIKII